MPPGIIFYQHEDGLNTLISSQLFLLRILATFEDLQLQQTDNYKSVWEIHLFWQGDECGELELYDYKGAPGCKFRGDDGPSHSALKLLEWLVSENVPHPYDGILAGTAA